MTRIIGIVSGKGGVGKSTVALNLALALKKFKKNVMLIDCNLSTPHLSYFMGATDYEGTINDVLKERIDINEALYNYSGVKYLPASVKFDDLIGVELTRFKKHLGKIDKNMDFVILDAAPGLGKEALFVLDAAKEVLFVTNPFVPMVGDVIRCKEVLKQFGEKKMSILLNMVTYKGHELKKDTIEQVTGLPIIGEIPHDKHVMQSMIVKYPLLEFKPDSLSSIGFMRIASLLTEKEYEVPMKVKVHRALMNVRNFVMPSTVKISQDADEIKKELLSNY